MALTKIDSSMYEDVSGANNLVKLDANAKIPAGAATNLTNLPGPEKSSSDPTVSSNKAVGTQWLNTSSGEMYVCTDATAGANVWRNVGAGTGDIVPWLGGWTTGTQYGYAMGGFTQPSAVLDTIQKYSFTSDGNSTDVANLTSARGHDFSGCSSSTYGYANGGGPPASPSTASNVIDKHQYGTSNNSTDVGDLTLARYASASCEGSSYGYVMGGATPTKQNIIERYPFASDTNASDVGDLTQNLAYCCGSASGTHGYTHGGNDGAPSAYGTDKIEKFALASSANSTLYSGVILGTYTNTYGGGTGSRTHGYTYGRWAYDGSSPVTAFRDTIDKFSYATEANATDVGNLVVARARGSASSSTTHGYAAGGRSADGNTFFNHLEKHSFASDGNATDVGDMLVVITEAAGNQY